MRIYKLTLGLLISFRKPMSMNGAASKKSRETATR